MKYEVYYYSTDKMKCLVEAENEDDAKRKFDEHDTDAHEYVIDVKQEFIEALLIPDRNTKAV